MNTKHQSPDMVEYSEVIAVITNYPKAFASEKDMAQILRCISNLPKYDLKPVADNITNNNIYGKNDRIVIFERYHLF